MNVGTTILLAGTIVVVGKWANDQHIDARTVIMIVVLALGVTIVDDINAELGHAFGLLVLVSATFGYGPFIFKKLGWMK